MYTRKGFLLIEVVIAAVILHMSLAMSAYMYSIISQMNEGIRTELIILEDIHRVFSSDSITPTEKSIGRNITCKIIQHSESFVNDVSCTPVTIEYRYTNNKKDIIYQIVTIK